LGAKIQRVEHVAAAGGVAEKIGIVPGIEIGADEDPVSAVVDVYQGGGWPAEQGNRQQPRNERTENAREAHRAGLDGSAH